MPLPEVIALDLDGTTLAPDGRVSPTTRAALDRVRAAGITIVFATGRSYTESRPVLEQAGHDGPGVFVGGSLVADHPGGTTRTRTHLPPDAARTACRVMLDHGTLPIALMDRHAAEADYLLQAGTPIEPARAEWFETMGVSLREVPDLAEHPHHDTIRVSVLAPTETNAAAERALRAELDGRVHTHQLDVRVPGQNLLEVFDRAANKWAGLRSVTDADPAGIVAVGDDLNDWHMIEAAGLGVAMGNAHPEIKRLADRTIGTNADDGLATFLDELLEAEG